MATYTKQQLIDAYCVKTGCGSSASELQDEVIRLQTVIDERIFFLTARKNKIITLATEQANQIQSRINEIEPDAKEKMKDIALKYLASLEAAQSKIDNDGVNL